nr:hypothetical protein [Candidatus Paceibacterota bacterium]
ETELAPLYEEHKGKYKNLKDALIADLETVLAPMRERRDAITDNDVKAILEAGALRARELASTKMREVREKIGIAI